MFFNTPFLHFHILHTFTSMFHIYTYAKIFVFTFSLIMADVRSKRRALLLLVFTSNDFLMSVPVEFSEIAFQH